MAQWCSFWTTDLKNAETALRQSLVSHIITAKHAAPYMIRNRSGLIVEVTENDVLSAGGNPVTQAVKFALKGLALNMAAELRPYGVSAVAITPGFLRSETMLERFGVTEETWREGAKKDKNFLESESPLFVGRAVAALAGDPAILERSGRLLSSWELGREYRFTDADGRRPDFRVARHSGTIASNVHKSDLRTAPTCVRLKASEGPSHLCELVLTEGLPVTRAKDYSYLKATIGCRRIARRAGM
jgi:NAD(P)-dependent dehydrogenase (short-subunit alcohol dehydrogenase family)